MSGNQLVGLILHGSYHVDPKTGQIVPQAKLAMRVYSATEKIISKGECSGRLEANALAGSYDAIVGGLAGLGVNPPEINEVLGEFAMVSTSALDVNLSVDVGLKKGWNTVCLRCGTRQRLYHDGRPEWRKQSTQPRHHPY